jgi:subfamily B ATP-binding cassette protein MsbA
LFEGTIRANILFPRPNATEQELQNAVKAAYVNEFTDRFDDGLDTLIGERGVKLSGGQRQRLAIARAILADPKIIILDEATSSLDTESESLIQKSLSELVKDRTTIVIAHRLSTIKQNILFPRPDASEEELQNAVNAAYVNEFTDRFDNGLDTLIGERGVKLSGGQRQRLAIARAILADPKIIILDEATSSLDTESESLIQKSLSELVKDRTTIVIAHRLSTIKQADQILVIEAGRIAERGTHDELIAVKGRYFDLFTYQSKI